MTYFIKNHQFELSPAQLRNVRWLAEGKTIKDIAKEYHYSTNTIRCQINAAMQRNNVKTKAQLVLEAYKAGVI